MPPATARDRTKYIREETDSADTESQHGADEQENRKGPWVRVHGIRRRTLRDPMRDEQPFCQDLTERRRTTVKFLEQQSETTQNG